jgi:hypothetical protein
MPWQSDDPDKRRFPGNADNLCQNRFDREAMPATNTG